MDHHVHAAITAGLRRRGGDVLTAQEDETAQASDEQLLDRATQLGRVLFSQDEDLLALAHLWLQTSRPFAGLVYAHQLSITVGQAVRDLELIARALDATDMQNRIVFIPF
jgi:predicted nuclease of predicted toxin-antitoxin system